MTLARSTLVGAIVAALVAFAVARVAAPGAGSIDIAAPASDVFDRVISTGVIRCGYVPYPPGCIKDPNTGELSGVFVDALEAAANNLGLRVEWTEEVGWGTMIAGLGSRYDMIGSQVWANSSRAKRAGFTVPLFYSGIGAYVRADDHRFDDSLALLNDSGVTVATIDGEMSEIIQKQDYPKSRASSHPELSDNSQILLDVVTKKADVTFVEPYVAELFLTNHPGSIRNVAADRPLRVFPNTMMVPLGEERLRSMLNTALTELINVGTVDRLLDEYVPRQGSFYLVAYPYRVP